jgi:hypothetical protein
MMRRASGAALTACLLAAGIAAAQIPRDPVANAASTPQSAGATNQRQLPASFVTKQSEVEIPFTVRGGTTPETQPTSVRIFVSWDSGQTWHFYEERRPEDARFRFRARQDGEFWFATQTIDRSGRPDSAEPRSPQLRLVIDTQRPQLLVQANVDTSGNVNLSWSATDANLAPASLKLEYQDAAGTGGPWQPIEVKAAPPNSTQLSGQTIFLAAVSSRFINLRAEIADAAGNAAFFSQRLSLTPPKPKVAGGLASAPAADPSATRWPTENPHANRAPTSQLAADSAAVAPGRDNEEVKIPNVVNNPFVGPGRLASRPVVDNLPPPTTAETGSSSDAWRANQQPAEPSVTQERLPPPGESGNAAANSQPSPAASGVTPSTNSVYETAGSSASPVPSYEPLPTQPAYRENGASSRRWSDFTPRTAPPAEEVMPTPQPAEPVEAPTAQRPRLTNSRRFSLEYDIQTVGPEGVSAVELWGTTDGGRTWVKWGSDPDKNSPFDVEVNHEAAYGFRIVVVGKNGLATTTPRAGDAADIWVGVDLTRPVAKLTGAAYGQGEAAGKLDIRWQADDTNLGSRPISLAIGDRPDGPFTPIAAGLPNTGQYFWAYDPRSPRQIYLRLEVRDDAGNIAIDQLTEPIKVEGLEPKGQIRGFSPGPAGNRGASRAPLFR